MDKGVGLLCQVKEKPLFGDPPPKGATQVPQGVLPHLPLNSPLVKRNFRCQNLRDLLELHFTGAHDHNAYAGGGDDGGGLYGDDDGDFDGGEGSCHLLRTNYAPAILLGSLPVSSP